MEAGKAEAIKKAEALITSAMEQENNYLRNELSLLKSKMEFREEELGRLIGRSGTGTQISCIKEEIDKLENRVNELETQLVLRESDLSRAVADSEVRK